MVSNPWVWKENWLSCAHAWVANNAQQNPSRETQKWSIKQGYFKQLLDCKSCPTDAECVKKMEGPRLRIRYTCYRVLGNGTALSDSRWVALLSGKMEGDRSSQELGSMLAAWTLGHLILKRQGFYVEIHRLPGRTFDIKSYLGDISRYIEAQEHKCRGF